MILVFALVCFIASVFSLIQCKVCMVFDSVCLLVACLLNVPALASVSEGQICSILRAATLR